MESWDATCYCLCSVNHSDNLGICTGEATTALRYRQFVEGSPLADREHCDVQMCEACKVATLAHKRAKEFQDNAS